MADVAPPAGAVFTLHRGTMPLVVSVPHCGRELPPGGLRERRCCGRSTSKTPTGTPIAWAEPPRESRKLLRSSRCSRHEGVLRSLPRRPSSVRCTWCSRPRTRPRPRGRPSSPSRARSAAPPGPLRDGPTAAEQQRLEEPEHELHRANEILKLACGALAGSIPPQALYESAEQYRDRFGVEPVERLMRARSWRGVVAARPCARRCRMRRCRTRWTVSAARSGPSGRFTGVGRGRRTKPSSPLSGSRDGRPKPLP